MTHLLAIETHSLSKTYKNVSVLKSLDLAVPANSIFGFLGPNGAGKTTTMKLLLGLIRPTGGSGTILGHNITQESLSIRARIGYLPQQPHFIDSMTARETLRFTAHFFFSGPDTKIEQRIDDMLDLVGLADKADRPVKGFSGGERQRLGLALAQINDPELLILDEPAAALDPLGRRDVLAVMERLRERTTIFYSTHILDDVQQVSDTVAILNHGQLVAQGPIEQLLNGGDQMVYTVTLEGADIDSAHARIVKLPWVSQVDRLHHNGTTTWQISVTDEQAAKEHLLRQILSDERLIVTGFNQKKYELEEIFMNIVEGA
ncbi:MAG: ABC transporter ATP-binding protein [Anaerolineae bacterium]|nr:ABC transporter ATP-binding protein [Anaerolineae bacterium]